MNPATGMTEAYNWHGRDVVDRDGERIGSVEEVYYATDDRTPEWLAVETGLFGMKTSFVPVEGARPRGEDVQVAYTKNQVKDAPGVAPDEVLSQAQERELWAHYGLEYGAEPSYLSDESDRAVVGEDVSGRETDEAMTRSEEELRVGTREREGGRARLRKHVVTEHVTETVPVRKEKAVVDREPITDANRDAATSGPEISDEEHEVVLSEEEVVVEKKAVPKERVRLDKKTLTEERQVDEEVRKERIEAEGEVEGR